MTRKITIRLTQPSFTITCPYCRHAHRGIASYQRGAAVRCSSCGRPFTMS